MSEEMADEGFNDITNIDISPLCTKAMQEKYKDRSDILKYSQMDVRAMEFNEGAFDSIVDKATLDSVLVLVLVYVSVVKIRQLMLER